MRWLTVVHHLPDRTRLRASVLHDDRAASEPLADVLAAIPGVREVAVRPYTGSILVEHAEHVSVTTLVDAVRETLAIERVLEPGERPPVPQEVPAFSSIAKKLAVMVRDLDRDVRRHSQGMADIGILATLCFLAAGAAEVVTSGELPLPEWFTLAWWGYRTFTTAEAPVIAATG